MNKVTKIFRVACAALAGAALLTAAGCSNLFENVEKDGGSALAAGQAAGKAVLSVSVGSGARTLLPAGIDFDADGLTFTLSGAREGGASKELGEWSDSGDTKACANMAAASVSIDTGSWSFALKVSKDSGEVLYGNAEKTIEEGKNEISFGTLSESSGKDAADGNVSLVLSFPAGKVKSAEGVIYTLKDGTGAAEAKTLEITRGEGADSVTFTENAEAGTYIIKITLYTDGAKTAKTVYTELAVVAPGAESKAERTLDSLNELYTVTYELNGGSFAEGENIRTSYSAYEAFALPEPEKKDAEFAGWYESKNFSTAEVTGWKAGAKAGDVTLYARWSTAVTADNIVETIKSMTESGALKATGTFNSSLISEINSALKSLKGKESGVLVFLDLSDAEGLTMLEASNKGEKSFYGCENLSGIVLPDSVKKIGEYAFSYCSGLTSVVIGNSVENIGAQAFSYCRGLTSIKIPDSVTSIGASAFENCSGLTSVEIGNGVKSIGEYAFSLCSGLTSIKIPDSVTSIGASAFENCSGLTSVKIPDSVTSIGTYAFWDCSSLTRVEIGNGVKSIGNAAFYYCRGLTSVVIGNSVESIGDRAFSWCSGLTSVKIPDSVKSIGANAFEYCEGLTSVKIPNRVTSIGKQAFYGCYSLTRVEIGNGVKSIGKEAFYYSKLAYALFKQTKYWQDSNNKSVDVSKPGTVAILLRNGTELKRS